MLGHRVAARRSDRPHVLQAQEGHLPFADEPRARRSRGALAGNRADLAYDPRRDADADAEFVRAEASQGVGRRPRRRHVPRLGYLRGERQHLHQRRQEPDPDRQRAGPAGARGRLRARRIAGEEGAAHRLAERGGGRQRPRSQTASTISRAARSRRSSPRAARSTTRRSRPTPRNSTSSSTRFPTRRRAFSPGIEDGTPRVTPGERTPRDLPVPRPVPMLPGMLTLSLLRHAKSSWADPDLADTERPLAKRGMKAAPLVGAVMKREDLTPDLVLCSPAVRARAGHRLELSRWAKSAGGHPRSRSPKSSIRGPLPPCSSGCGPSARRPAVLAIGHNPTARARARLHRQGRSRPARPTRQEVPHRRARRLASSPATAGVA